MTNLHKEIIRTVRNIYYHKIIKKKNSKKKKWVWEFYIIEITEKVEKNIINKNLLKIFI